MADSLTVLHIDTERTWRGGEQQMCYLALGLKAVGHSAPVVCRPGSECETRAASFGLDVHPVAVRGDVALVAAHRLARLIDRLGVDIVHAHTSRAHLAAVLAKRFSRRKPLCVVHRRVDFSIHKLPCRISGLKYRWGVDRYIAITQAVKSVMVADGIPSDQIDIIHSSTDLSRFEGIERQPGLRTELGIPEDALLVGNVAALVGHKGQAFLLDAAAQVLKQCPKAFFLILGEGELRSDLEAQAESLGISDRIRMPGFRSDVPQCMAELDVFCMSSWGEGMGSVVLEAMAMRRPIVVTDAGGLVEVITNQKDGLVVPARDADALAKAMVQLLTHSSLAHRLAEAARQTVETRFSKESMVEHTLALYKRLLSATTS